MTEDVRAALGLTPSDGQDAPADELKSVSPGPATNVPAFENRVTPTVGAGREAMKHAGENSGGFELRVTPT